MKLTLTFSTLLLCLSSFLFAQTTSISGTITDGKTNEPLMFANVVAGTSGVVSDIDGKYTIEVPNGMVTLTFSYIGYEDETQEIQAAGGAMVNDVQMGANVTLVEIVVEDDIATDRKTPVAFTNIPTKKILEEIAGEDIASVVNSVPGAQYTQQGGGDGDARISIRGFSQRNVAVMIDGIPVNDMENGWVYWSNWFGLDVATKTVQVQRGLGASKLSIPSVGGTMNIITKGIQSKREVMFKQQIGNNGFTQTTVGLTSGRLKGGWGVTLAGSYKQGNGWVDQNSTQGGFYYAKIDKEIGKHILTVSAMGAPQNHGQRSFKAPASVYDPTYAREKLGMSDSLIYKQIGGFFSRSITTTDQAENSPEHYALGLRYNQHWGSYTNADGEEVAINTSKNYYHKPQFSFRHTWDVNDKLFVSNVLYASIGNGGGTSTSGTFGTFGFNKIGEEEYGQLKLQTTFVNNEGESSSDILRSSINSHRWYGLLSTFNYTLNDRWTVKGGLDLRTYTGIHTREVYDLLGGESFDVEDNDRNKNEDPTKVLGVGDRYGFNNEGLVRWAGGFGLLEYSYGNWSAFANISSAMTSYKKIDYHFEKVVELADTTIKIGYNTVAEHEGVTYDRNSAGLDYQQTDWKYYANYTFKGGVKYRLTKQHTLFTNMGYLSKAPRFNSAIYRFNLDFIETAKNEVVYAFELGYSFKSKKFSSNINVYHTNWLNKPLNNISSVPDPEDENKNLYPTVTGVKALHQGIEIDAAYRVFSKLTIEGLFSLGNWIWNSEATVDYENEDGVLVSSYTFDATGVHVGDAAQTQVGGLIRYEPIKNLYFKLKGTHFSRYYSEFSPSSLRYNPQRESWQIPAYTLFDAHAGYSHKFKNKMKLGVRFNVLNIFDLHYISDASNNDTRNNGLEDGLNFDAASAGVFFGQGRRFNASLQFTF